MVGSLLSGQSVDAFPLWWVKGVCCTPASGMLLPTVFAEPGEGSTGDQAGNSTVCYINGGCCSESFTKWAFFLQYIIIFKCYCIRSQ